MSKYNLANNSLNNNNLYLFCSKLSVQTETLNLSSNNINLKGASSLMNFLYKKGS